MLLLFKYLKSKERQKKEKSVNFVLDLLLKINIRGQILQFYLPRPFTIDAFVPADDC